MHPVAGLGIAVTHPALDTHRQPELLRRQIVGALRVSRKIFLCRGIVATGETHFRHRQQCLRHTGLSYQGTLQEFLGVLVVAHFPGAQAGIKECATRSLIQRILHRRHEMRNGFLFPVVLTQEPAIIVVSIRIVLVETQAFPEILFGFLVLA